MLKFKESVSSVVSPDSFLFRTVFGSINVPDKSSGKSCRSANVFISQEEVVFPDQVHVDYEFHETYHSVTFYFTKKDSK